MQELETMIETYKLLIDQKYTEEYLILGQLGVAKFILEILKPTYINNSSDYNSVHNLAQTLYPIIKKKADKLYQKAGWDSVEIAYGWAKLSEMLEDDSEFCLEIFRLKTY